MPTTLYLSKCLQTSNNSSNFTKVCRSGNPTTNKLEFRHIFLPDSLNEFWKYPVSLIHCLTKENSFSVPGLCIISGYFDTYYLVKDNTTIYDFAIMLMISTKLIFSRVKNKHFKTLVFGLNNVEYKLNMYYILDITTDKNRLRTEPGSIPNKTFLEANFTILAWGHIITLRILT